MLRAQDDPASPELVDIRKDQQQLLATADAFRSLCKRVAVYDEQLDAVVAFYHGALPRMGLKVAEHIFEHKESLREFLVAARSEGALVDAHASPEENRALISSLHTELQGLQRHAEMLARTQELLQVRDVLLLPVQLLLNIGRIVDAAYRRML